MSEDSPRQPKVTFRRRKRRRQSSEEGRQVLGAENGKRGKERGCNKIDKEDYDASVEQKSNVSLSLPEMLYMRATGRLCPRDFLLKRKDSTTAKRSIRFSQLQSSNSEAVLALEQSGSYFISLAGNTAAYTLALRLYAVPSPFVLEKANTDGAQQNVVVSPLVTVPLLIPADDDSDER